MPEAYALGHRATVDLTLVTHLWYSFGSVGRRMDGTQVFLEKPWWLAGGYQDTMDSVTGLTACNLASFIHGCSPLAGRTLRLVSKWSRDVSDLTREVRFSSKLFEVKPRVSERLNQNRKLHFGSRHPSEDVDRFVQRFKNVRKLTVKQPASSFEATREWSRLGQYRWYRVTLPRVSIQPMVRHAPLLESVVFSGCVSGAYPLRLGRHLPELSSLSNLTTLEFYKSYLGGVRFSQTISRLKNLQTLTIVDCETFSDIDIEAENLTKLRCEGIDCRLFVCSPNLKRAVVSGVRTFSAFDCDAMESLVVDYHIFHNMRLEFIPQYLIYLQLTNGPEDVLVEYMGNLRTVKVMGDHLQQVNVHACPMLTTIKIEETDSMICHTLNNNGDDLQCYIGHGLG